MDNGTKSLVNVLLSVLAPVLVLDHCSTEGPAFYELGTVWAMVIALALPIGCGIYTFWDTRKVDPITLFGLLGTILTGVVTVYANTGEGGAIRTDTPWWYAAKEALIAMLLCGAVLVTAKRKESMLRLFVYSDAIFDIPHIEQAVQEKGVQPEYGHTLWRANLMMAATLFVSAVANFLLALHFLLPVLDKEPAQQALEYNYAVSNMTWWGYLVIGVPLLLTLFGVIKFLIRRLEAITSLPSVTMR